MPGLLETKSLKKHFPGVEALRGIDLSLERGKIYGLVGENGAGKSTLIKILMGAHEPTEGAVYFGGDQVNIKNTYQARNELGIDATFQECALVPQLSVAENLFLDKLEDFYERGALNRGKLNDMAREALDRIGLDVDVTTPVSELSPSEEKLAELSKVLSHDPDVIIMDEVTAPLESSEVSNVFEVMRDLKEKDKTIIFISHRLDEVLEICEDVIVLRDGNLEGVIQISGKSPSSMRRSIIQMMTGGKTGLTFPSKRGVEEEAETLLSVKNLSTEYLKDINLSVYRGEIVALAGLRNHGQSELLRTIFGLCPKKSGEIYLGGDELNINCPKDAVDAGVFYISDDKEDEELFLTQDVGFNISLVSLENWTRLGIIDEGDEKETVEKIVSELDIETPSLAQLVRNLSGGNKQKVVLGKCLLAEPKAILVDQPTQGLDVGAKEEIYDVLRELSDRGLPILAVLTEISEVVNLPDRILVMREGRIAKEFSGEEIDKEKVLDSYYG